jgi:hypothetical protein
VVDFFLVGCKYCVCLFVFFLIIFSHCHSLCGKRKGIRIGSWDLPNLDTMYYYSALFFFFFFFSLLCFGCPAIVAVLVIVGRDTGRDAGEESVVAEDIAAEVFDVRFERNKES